MNFFRKLNDILEIVNGALRAEIKKRNEIKAIAKEFELETEASFEYLRAQRTVIYIENKHLSEQEKIELFKKAVVKHFKDKNP